MTLLDHILAFLLIVVIPVLALWRSRPGFINDVPNTRRYRATIAIVAGLLVLLAVDWCLTGRLPAGLGLAMPTTTPALVGLGVAAVGLVLLWKACKVEHQATAIEVEHIADDPHPRTPEELRLFLVLAVVIGFGWELLYRGFLLFYLPSYVGSVGALAVSALAYATAHGVKTPAQFSLSIVVSMAFTAAYALTSSLWWLIVLHSCLPLLVLAEVRSESAAGGETTP